MIEYTHKTIKAENQLLRKLCRLVKEIRFGSYTLELLELHLHLPQFEDSILHHSHRYVEIHTAVRGAGKVLVGKKQHRFSAGQFTVTRPDEFHSWQVVEPPLIMYVWWLNIPSPQDSEPGEIARLFDNLRRAKSVVYNLPDDFEVHFHEMLAELQKHQLGYDWMVRNQFQRILLNLARATIKGKKRVSTVSINTDMEDRVVKVVNHFLEDNLATNITLDVVAKYASMSKRSLTRHYRMVTGVTIGEKLQMLRIMEAARLLDKTDLPVKVIAIRCGMPDVSYFSKQFKRKFKLSPSDYRQQQH